MYRLYQLLYPKCLRIIYIGITAVHRSLAIGVAVLQYMYAPRTHILIYAIAAAVGHTHFAQLHKYSRQVYRVFRSSAVISYVINLIIMPYS
jgi:hypothetical protein